MPLTHHEIMGLVGPFSRSGHHVDLAASDRAARRLLFKPVERAFDDVHASNRSPLLTEQLELDCSGERHFRLRRTLLHQQGLQAVLEAEGPDPAALLAQVDAVPPERHFPVAPAGCAIARSYESLSSPAGLFLTRGEVRAGGVVLELELRLPRLRGVAGDFTLRPDPQAPLAQEGLVLHPTEDLLAVIGWDWARLVRKRDHWISKRRLRGPALRRTATAEAALQRAAAHLQRVLSEPPAEFHRRFFLARWGVVLRRSIPTLTVVGMIAGVLLLARHTDERSASIWMALQYLPIALLALSFSLQELPAFEFPPLPRRLKRSSWWGPAA